MQVIVVIVGCGFVVWPSVLRRQLRGVRDRAAVRGGKPERIDELLVARWWGPTMWLLRFVGVAVIALALAD